MALPALEHERLFRTAAYPGNSLVLNTYSTSQYGASHSNSRWPLAGLAGTLPLHHNYHKDYHNHV
jgi:hypothetical protein